MRRYLGRLKSPARRMIFELFINFLLAVQTKEERRQRKAHFINDRRISIRGRLSLSMFTATLLVVSFVVWGIAIIHPSELSVIMVTFHTAGLYAIWKLKPYQLGGNQ